MAEKKNKIIIFDGEDDEIINRLKQNLSDDIASLINTTFELDSDRDPTPDELDFVQEVSIDALTATLIDVLVATPLGGNRPEREKVIGRVCAEIKRIYLERSEVRTMEIN